MNEKPKKFHIVDREKGEFELYDKVYRTFRKWKINEDVPAGYQFLNDKISRQSTKLRKPLPGNYDLLSKSEQKKIWSDYINGLSETEREQYLKSVKSNADRQLILTCSLVEPLHEIPDVWADEEESVLMHFASCLTGDRDIQEINDFFLVRLGASMKSQEEKQEPVNPETKANP